MFDTFADITILTIVLPIAAYLFKFKRLDLPLKLIGLLLLFSASSDIICSIFYWKGMSNVVIFEYYTLLEGLSVLLFFSSVFQPVISKIIKFIFAPVLLIVWLLSQKTWVSEGAVSAVECFLILALCVLFYVDVVFYRFKYVAKKYAHLFTINTALFLYFGINVTMYFFIERLRATNRDMMSATWYIHMVIQIIFNLMLTFSLARKRTNS